MRKLRKSSERGHANHGWLDTFHSFSFDEYYDPKYMAFRSLRVMNEDTVAGSAGFPFHGHRDMEIVTYVMEGALQHRDTLGNTEVLRPGEIQRMTAGTGIQHSEFNPQPKDPTHLYQIWIMPERAGLTPSYEQVDISKELNAKGRVLAAAPEGGAVKIHQDARLWIERLKAGETRTLEWKRGRGAWVQVVNGELTVEGPEGWKVGAGDGLAIENETALSLKANADSEYLFFDLA